MTKKFSPPFAEREEPLTESYISLLEEVRHCRLCEVHLPLGPRPVIQFHPDAQILIAGQAPGRKVHETGIPFNDPSGDRLRQWLNLSKEVFYDPTKIALVPMGFCFPGTASGGDLPPRPECATTWRHRLLKHLPNLRLTLPVGRYAVDYHLGKSRESLANRIQKSRSLWNTCIPMPHPSPRNIRWFKNNPWFEENLVPIAQQRVHELLSTDQYFS